MVLDWLLGKAVGVFLVLAGIFLILFFPAPPGQQNSGGVSFDKTGIIIGIILFFAGIYLLIS